MAEVSNSIKSVINPRRVKFFVTPHFPVNLEGGTLYNLSTDEIVINHYYTKSREEFLKRTQRGDAIYNDNSFDMKKFEERNLNDVFDDGILKYHAARRKALKIDDNAGLVKFFAQSTQVDYVRLTNALIQNLYPMVFKDLPQDFFKNKMETFLVCRELADFLQTNSITEKAGKFFEELALEAIYQTMLTDMTIIDANILLNELPKLTVLDYPVVRKIYASSIVVANNLKNVYAEQASYVGNFELGNQSRTFERLANMLEVLNPFKDD